MINYTSKPEDITNASKYWQGGAVSLQETQLLGSLFLSLPSLSRYACTICETQRDNSVYFLTTVGAYTEKIAHADTPVRVCF